jgi:hypothetical protein
MAFLWWWQKYYIGGITTVSFQILLLKIRNFLYQSNMLFAMLKENEFADTKICFSVL